MNDRDILEEFDKALPRLETYGPGCVPAAGSSELFDYRRRTSDRRTELGIFSAATALTAAVTWFMWMPWVPLWLLVPMAILTSFCGAATARSFLQLAFAKRLEQALPPGTDVKTAQLEDGTWSLIRSWNADAFVWNQRVAALRFEVVDWLRFRDVPEARDIEWTEHGSSVRAEGLFAQMQGYASERAALVARKKEIDHRRRSLDARLLHLQASEETPTLALPPPSDDEDDG